MNYPIKFYLSKGNPELLYYSCLSILYEKKLIKVVMYVKLNKCDKTFNICNMLRNE